MKKIAALLFVFVVCLPAALQAQAPKPDPSLLKLKPLIGHWMYEGEYKPGAWGPGSKVRGEYTERYILQGFALEARSVEKVGDQAAHYLEIDAFDSLNKDITFSVWSDAGTHYSGTISAAGNTITWEGTVVAGGKQYRIREPAVFSEDLMSCTLKGEISTDGKAWSPYFEATYTRVEPTEKKPASH
jgi:Protein of unknown function (DUF1579)